MTARRLGRLLLELSPLIAVTAGCAVAAVPAGPSARGDSPTRTATGSDRPGQAASRPGPRPGHPLIPARMMARALPSWAIPVLAHDVPAGSGQVVIVRAPSMSSTTNTVSLWTWTATGWRETGTLMPGHNGERGWSAHRKAGDLQTPTGVYTLTAAGGRLPNPGTREPYEYSKSYFHTAGHFLGHNTFGVFDYVVAIDFNRIPGSPVSSTAEPWGPGPGGDIWLHVDNGAPTLGCVTVSRSDLVTVLTWLNPSEHPVIVLSAG